MLMAVVQHREPQFLTLFKKLNTVFKAQIFIQDEPSSNVCPSLEETPKTNASGRLLEVEIWLAQASREKQKIQSNRRFKALGQTKERPK